MKRLARFALLALLAGCGKTSHSTKPNTSAGVGGVPTTNVGEAGNGGSAGLAVTEGSGGEPVECLPGEPGCAENECSPGIPVTTQFTLLTPMEYDFTVRDLLGVVDGFQLSASVSRIDDPIIGSGWSALENAAERVAAAVRADETLLNRFLACMPSDASETQCFHDTIVSFGRRAFRRPLTDREIARFEKVVAQGPQITATGSPEEIAEVLLIAFLSSPSFLQRTELVQEPSSTSGTESLVLSPHEMASRLSYLFWASTPDAELDEAADTDQLKTKEQLHEQAQRMLMDPKAGDQIAAFHRFYLGMELIDWWNVPEDKDPERFPSYDFPETVDAMREELNRFFARVAYAGGTFQDLFLSPLGFVNAYTAQAYGLDPREFGDELEEVTLDAMERPGFLTRLDFLSAFSGHDRTVPSRRGALIGAQLLNFAITLAPEPVHATTPPPNDPALDTNRKRVAAQTSAPSCKGCHSIIDPLGFVFETYDAIGAHQTHEADTGAPIVARSEVFDGSDWVKVENAMELMQLLANSPRAQRRYAEAWVSFAFRRAPNPMDACIVDDLAARLAEGSTIIEMMAAITLADSFQFRTRGQP